MKKSCLLWMVSCVLLLTACSGDESERLPARESETAALTPAPSNAVSRAPSDANAPPPPAAASASAPKMAPASGVARRDTELKAKPTPDAPTIRQLARGTKLVIADRQGGWLHVVIGKQAGWVRLLHISSQPAGSGGISVRELESAAKIATGRTGGGNVVATTGIRGLDEDELRTAEPDPEQLKKLDAFAVSREQAAEYAKAHQLVRRDVPKLKATP